jgi:hypothetical protein
MESPKRLGFNQFLQNSPSFNLLKHYLPNFSFHVSKGPTTSQFKELAEIHFPGCTSVAYAPPFLVVSWKELPMKP